MLPPQENVAGHEWFLEFPCALFMALGSQHRAGSMGFPMILLLYISQALPPIPILLYKNPNR